MNNDVFSKAINKGIPTSTSIPIILRYIDLYGILEQNAKFDAEMDKQISTLLGKIGAEKNGFRFMRSLQIKTNPDTLEREIVLSPMAFVNSLMMNLNVADICNKHLTSTMSFDPYTISDKEFYDRIKCLKRVKSEEEFKSEFPYLYAQYERDSSSYKPYLAFKKNFLNNPKVSDYDKKRVKVALWNELTKGKDNVDLDFNSILSLVMSPLYVMPEVDINSLDTTKAVNMIDKFFQTLDEQSTDYKIGRYVSNLSSTIGYLVSNRGKINSYLLSHPLDFSFLNESEHRKLELYITYMYLRIAESAKKFEDKQKLLYYVSNYFFENQELIDSDLSIVVDSVPVGDQDTFNIDNKDGYSITPKDLYQRYRRLLIDNPDLRVVDSSKFDFSNMSLEDVNHFMEDYLKDLSVTWDFLPPEEVEIYPGFPPRGGEGKPMSADDLELLKRRTIDLFMEKKEFYGSTNPMFRVRGKKTFDGYIGYIYPNGKVVLDKFFENAEKGELAYGNAVYIMNLDDFYELSKFSKTELIRDRLCKRFVHAGEWKDRVLKEINSGKSESRDMIRKKLLENNVVADNGNNN